MRRSFDGLSMLAEHLVQCNPLSGHLFVYCNRRTDRLKILYWDRDGWAIWYKRLEVGTFQYPFSAAGRQEIAAWELGVLLEGIDLQAGRRRKRYSLPAAEPAPGGPGGGGMKNGRRRPLLLLPETDSR